MDQSSVALATPVHYPPEAGPTITTASGKVISLLAPEPESMDIEDIALALSRIPRWNGHTSQFYSVAQHSVWVSEWVCTLSDIPESPKLALAGLLHDAAEAYLGDITSPLKSLFPMILGTEGKIMRAICERFGLDWPLPPEVKHCDKAALATEKAQLRGGIGTVAGVPALNENIVALPAKHAKSLFLGRYYELVAAIGGGK